MKKIKQKLNQKNKGFVILFSMLISSIILLISSGVYNIVQKQVVLSSYARESQKAFYAADAALDCALFNDISHIITATAFSVENPSSGTIECGGGETRVFYLSGAGTTGDDDFKYPFTFRYYGLQDLDGVYIGSGCAYVLVEKNGSVDGPITTRITAAGFNTCKKGDSGEIDTPDFDNPTLLERRLSLEYLSA